MKSRLAATATVLLSCSLFGKALPQNPAVKRGCNDNCISSCGEHWMASETVFTNNNKIEHRGFNQAVDYFCEKAHGSELGGHLYLSMATRVWLGGGGNTTTNGIRGYVYFEIHNNRDNSHKVDGGKCKSYLKELSKGGSQCYGDTNHDTKGGTWQTDNRDISYHALPKKVPPTDPKAVDQIIVLDSEIKELGGNGKGNTLDPFPTYFLNDVVPVRCHSHNDYERDTSLYSALSAGCIGIEADVHVRGGKLLVSHDNPDTSIPIHGVVERPTVPTIDDLYINPIMAILDDPAHKGKIFPKYPDQGIYLLVDFKEDGDKTWDLLVKALEPLRTKGYLTKYDSTVKLGPVTVIASGNAIKDNAPISKAKDTATNPDRSIFVDARVHEDMKNFDESNTFYASANFKDAITGSGSRLEGGNLNKLRDQIRKAHDKHFAVRYWDIPSSNLWQQLVDEKLDRLNVDDLQAIAGIDWHL